MAGFIGGENTSVTPCSSYQRSMRRIVSSNPMFARQPRPVRFQSGPGPRLVRHRHQVGQQEPTSSRVMPKCSTTTSKISLIVRPSPVDTLYTPEGTFPLKSLSISDMKSCISRKSRTVSSKNTLGPLSVVYRTSEWGRSQVAGRLHWLTCRETHGTFAMAT